MILGIRHTGLVVSRMDRSLRFYRDILGLTVLVDYTQEGPYISRLTGVRHAKVRMVKLGVTVQRRSRRRNLLQRTGLSGVIELLEFQKPSRVPRLSSKTRGLSHIAFAVQDIDSVYRNRNTLSMRFIFPPQLSPDGFAKVAYVRDPDGIVVELVQIMATRNG